jgi:hypothetical protein
MIRPSIRTSGTAGMPRLLTDHEIGQLLTEVKPLPSNWETKLTPRAKANSVFLQRELEVTGNGGHRFRIILRQSTLNPLDFSVILTFIDADRTEYRLIRCNGKHPSDHTNKYEKRFGGTPVKFRNVFHIHRATERYQTYGYEIDGFGEPVTLYNSFEGAKNHFIGLFGFEIQQDDPRQHPLF